LGGWQAHLPIRTQQVRIKPVFRLSKLTDYAVVVLTQLGRAPQMADCAATIQTAPGIATATGLAEPTVAKVLKLLGQGGLVASTRGARGGYALARPLSRIPVSDVIVAVEGPIALAACVDGAVDVCECECTCPMRGRWDPVNAAIKAALSAITLADMQASTARRFAPSARLVAEPALPTA
jgi:FeS assembly SUF system regulator